MLGALADVVVYAISAGTAVLARARFALVDVAFAVDTLPATDAATVIRANGDRRVRICIRAGSTVLARLSQALVFRRAAGAVVVGRAATAKAVECVAVAGRDLLARSGDLFFVIMKYRIMIG